MPLQGIDAARNSLWKASNNYADIQKQLDRYNKVFETYANASPETQIRAASVMRQALNEYNGLKRQQEENALRIFEAQSWVDYYNKNKVVQTSQLQPQQNIVEAQTDLVRAVPTETIAILNSGTPWALNNNTPSTNAEVNAIDTNNTMNVPASTTSNTQSTVNPTIPVGVSNIIKSQTPTYPSTTISPTSNATVGWNKVTWTPNYWAGSVVWTPWTTTAPRLNTNTSSLWKRVENRIVPVVRKVLNGVYNYLTR